MGQAEGRQLAAHAADAAADPDSDVAPALLANRIAQLPAMDSFQQISTTASRLERKSHGHRQNRDRSAQQSILQWQSNPESMVLRRKGQELMGPQQFQLQPGLGQHGSICTVSSSKRSCDAERLLDNIGMWSDGRAHKSGNLVGALGLSWSLKAREVDDAETMHM